MKTISVKATTANKLSDTQLKKIESAVAKKYPNQKVVISTAIDKNIIGGIKLRINTIELDASVASKLEQLRAHLLDSL